MGFFWDIAQEIDLNARRDEIESLEQRVEELERHLGNTNRLLVAVLHRLEAQLGEDIDSDGKVG